MSSKLVPIALMINPSEIVVFKFILESYEGLAELRTLNSDTGKLLVLATEDTAGEVYKLLESIKDQHGIVVVPEDKLREFMHGEEEDWLSSEI